MKSFRVWSLPSSALVSNRHVLKGDQTIISAARSWRRDFFFRRARVIVAGGLDFRFTGAFLSISMAMELI